MATGYDENGLDEELLCVEPPGADFLPTAMCAVVVEGDDAPSLPFGVAGFSMEVWLKWEEGNDSPGSDIAGWLGALDPVGGPPLTNTQHGAALRVSSTDYTVRAHYDETLSGLGGGAGTGATGLEWKHYVLNYDRSGNLEVFVDTTSEATFAINANNFPACQIWPYISGELDERAAAMANNDDADWFGNIVSRMWQGPMAVHNRLLTAAEIQESLNLRRVQNISGVTQILWDPRNIEGHTGWEIREDYICSLDRGLLHFPFGAPQGTYGTVVLPDSSGNGNDFNLPVAASYQDEQTGGLGVGSRARCCFIADPWWR